jgi:hypothetical protein
MPEKNGEVKSESTEEAKIGNGSIATKSSKPCVCPRCGKLVPSQIETPCYKRCCPKCESKMLSL